MKKLIIPITAVGLSACSMIQMDRSRSSGYAEGQDAASTVQDYYHQKRVSEVNGAKTELGLADTAELADWQTAAVRTRLLLNRLEKAIPNEQDRRQYYALKPYFPSDRHRVEFLRLPTREARERYAAVRNIGPETKFDNSTQKLIDDSDVAKGMSREAVKVSWGEPDAVETAGNPLHGNERWVYRKLMSTEDGYRQETRMIYFESGRVSGWETE